MRRRHHSPSMAADGRSVVGRDVDVDDDAVIDDDAGMPHLPRVDVDDVDDCAPDLRRRRPPEEDDSSSSSSSSSPSSSSSTSRCVGLRRRRILYALHTLGILCVILRGIVHNGGRRKYVSVDSRRLSSLLESPSSSSSSSSSWCAMGHHAAGAYVDVHSATMHEDRAVVVCCSDATTTVTTATRTTATRTTARRISQIIVEDDRDVSSEEEEEDGGWYADNLCHPRVPILGYSMHDLPYANRLTRLFEAWCLPLFPILLHLACISTTRIWRITSDRDDRIASSSGRGGSPARLRDPYDGSTIGTAINRLLFYVLLLIVRGFGLYLGANAIEGYVVRAWRAMTSTEPYTNDDDGMSHHRPCWYEDVLKAHQRRWGVDGVGSTSITNVDVVDGCYGRRFDFSDHVVLFVANYLVIFAAEASIVCSIAPYWHRSKRTTDGAAMMRVDGGGVRRRTERYSLFSYDGPGAFVWKVALASSFAYMHLLVCHALYRTAAYFHTPAEILVGFLISAMIQLPVMYLMCSEATHRARAFIGLQ